MSISPDELAYLLQSPPARNAGTPLNSIFDPPAERFDSTGMDLSALGLGAKLSPSSAPQGQHSNAELPAKLAEAKAAQARLAALYQNIAGALSTNQGVLLASPTTAGLVATAQNALSDLQTLSAQLDGSLWNGKDFGNFSGSNDAWNSMDAAIQAANQKLSTYSQLSNQLAGGVAQAQATLQASQQKAAQDQAAADAGAAAQAQALANARNRVQSAVLSANGQASLGNFAQALATLSDPNVVAAANAVGAADQLANAVNTIGIQQQVATRQQQDAAVAKTAAEAQAARQAQIDAQNLAAQQAAAQRADAIAASTASAQAAQAQAGFDLQRFQAQLAADSAARSAERDAAREGERAQLEADRRARQDQFDKLQLLLTAAPILGKDIVAGAFAAELGLDLVSANAAADQAGAGSAIAQGTGTPFHGFSAETF